MGYSERLRDLFKGISLQPEDLLLLESFQIAYLPDRVPQKEFAALLRAYPHIHRFLISKNPSIEEYINSIFEENNPVDVLVTSNAIGWNLEKELHEIERVVKSNGQAIHLMRIMSNELENALHDRLISPEWNYQCSKHQDSTGLKLKYFKTIF